jgi:hypothetical protein
LHSICQRLSCPEPQGVCRVKKENREKKVKKRRKKEENKKGKQKKERRLMNSAQNRNQIAKKFPKTYVRF